MKFLKKKYFMANNVFIFGAGASFDAKIPLLRNFIERMWEIREKGYGGMQLAEFDRVIFDKASAIKEKLDNYHGRSEFDDLNIEDILSILSFDCEFGDPKINEDMNSFVKAIARTIELTCEVKHDGKLNKDQKDGDAIYRQFWINLFHKFSETKEFPTIISFNYDIVLERSLFQTLVNKKRLNYPFSGIDLKYYFNTFDPLVYEITPGSFYTTSGSSAGTILKYLPEKENDVAFPPIEILKLNGSVNFPRSKEKITGDPLPTSPVENPSIVPPIAKKVIENKYYSIWQIALKRIRNARNIIFVGYNLPETDVYFITF